jgi:uncharacterized cupredoxin-like copper-binding protein
MRVVGISVLAAIGVLAALGAAMAFAFRSSERSSAVNVTVREMSVTVAPKSVPEGKVTLTVRNVGQVEHELVVLRRESLRRLPVRNFKAQEPEADVIGEAEDIEAGKSKRLVLTLHPGRYLLFCNIHGHYQLGMANHLLVR